MTKIPQQRNNRLKIQVVVCMHKICNLFYKDGWCDGTYDFEYNFTAVEMWLEIVFLGRSIDYHSKLSDYIFKLKTSWNFYFVMVLFVLYMGFYLIFTEMWSMLDVKWNNCLWENIMFYYKKKNYAVSFRSHNCSIFLVSFMVDNLLADRNTCHKRIHWWPDMPINAA